MAKRTSRRNCACCHALFVPGKYNAWHQEYCTKAGCRKARKAASQNKWLAKEENHSHFRGPTNVLRVQEWRKNHPGYWRRKAPKGNDALLNLSAENQSVDSIVVDHWAESLRDLENGETEQNQGVWTNTGSKGENALQDVVNSQQAVLAGLVAQITGSALQDFVAQTLRNMEKLGRDILNQP